MYGFGFRALLFSIPQEQLLGLILSSFPVVAWVVKYLGLGEEIIKGWNCTGLFAASWLVLKPGVSLNTTSLTTPAHPDVKFINNKL